MDGLTLRAIAANTMSYAIGSIRSNRALVQSVQASLVTLNPSPRAGEGLQPHIWLPFSPLGKGGIKASPLKHRRLVCTQ